MLDLDIDVKELDQAISDIGATRIEVQRALNSTFRKFSTWVKNQSAKGLSKELKIKLKVLRRRVKQFRVKQTQDGNEVTIWFGTNPVGLIFLGARQTRSGVVAQGGRSVKGAFIAKMKSGYRGVFKRVGTKRLGIAEQDVEMDSKVVPYLESSIVGSQSFETQFWKIFQKELQWQTR